MFILFASFFLRTTEDLRLPSSARRPANAYLGTAPAGAIRGGLRGDGRAVLPKGRFGVGQRPLSSHLAAEAWVLNDVLKETRNVWGNLHDTSPFLRDIFFLGHLVLKKAPLVGGFYMMSFCGWFHLGWSHQFSSFFFSNIHRPSLMDFARGFDGWIYRIYI